MIVIVDYGMGNLASIANMGRRAGGSWVISGDPNVIVKAHKLVLPGVGAYDNGMLSMRERGLIPILNDLVIDRKIPILGICLGVQLFTRCSEEGHLPGLNWIAANTRRFSFSREQASMKIPHMGWNFIEPAKKDSLLSDLPPDPRFYFVHSYYLDCDDASDVLAWTTYGARFASVVRRGNIWGTQFHPEKSHKYGLALLKNFLTQS